MRDIVASLLAPQHPGTSTRLTLILCVQQTDTEMAVQTGDEVKVLKSSRTEQKKTDAPPGAKTRTVLVQKDASDVVKQAAANNIAAAAAADLAQAMEEDDTVSTSQSLHRAWCTSCIVTILPFICLGDMHGFAKLNWMMARMMTMRGTRQMRKMRKRRMR